jgi:hypothetical protein
MTTDEIPHGTYSGYQKHKRLRIKPCAECREANRTYHQAYRTDPATRRREREQARIADAAKSLLLHRHYDEYRQIVAELTEQGEQLRRAS